MWLSQSALDRIRELELALRDSVPGDVYERSLARIADLERRVDWQSDMLLRRGQTYPLPAVKAEGEKPAQVQPAIPETAIWQAEAIRQAGKEANASQEEIETAIREQTGYSARELAEAAGRVM